MGSLAGAENGESARAPQIDNVEQCFGVENSVIKALVRYA